MKKRISTLAVTLLAILCAGRAEAQVLPGGLLPFGHYLLPANPTSADNLRLSLNDQTCGSILPYKANPYRVSMSQNIITVTLGEQFINPIPTCPPAPREEIDLGRLPPGNYTLNVIAAAISFIPNNVVISNVAFTVSDARVAKNAPFVRLDYSGQWWDSNDSGWGLFIWHDARDNVLAAWFTYATDGKPMWYVFQPRWQTSAATFTTDLLQTSRPPGTTSPPPNPTAIVVAGTASLDFTNFGTADVGKLTYTFIGGPTLVRNIQRFKP